MKTLTALSQRFLRLFLADVSAGACIADAGCCCNSARTKRLNCYASCVTGSCRYGSGSGCYV